MSIPTVPSPVVKDLGKFFADRLRRHIKDMAEAANVVDADPDEVAFMLVSVLATELVLGAEYMELDEEEFINLCVEAYKLVKERTHG